MATAIPIATGVCAPLDYCLSGVAYTAAVLVLTTVSPNPFTQGLGLKGSVGLPPCVRKMGGGGKGEQIECNRTTSRNREAAAIL